MGRALKAQRPGADVRGIEPDVAAASTARLVLDDVLAGRAEDPLPPGWPVPDCLIFADVLEHMVDPWSCLVTWRQRLPENGTVVLSIPNVVHYGTVWELLRGRWNYRDQGILDRTHLRFFTRKTAVELVEGAGFKIQKLARNWSVPDALRPAIPWLERWDHVGWDREHVAPPQGTRLADYFTLQYLIVARC